MDSKIKNILYEYAKDINLLMKHEHKKDEICDYMFEILQKVNFIKNKEKIIDELTQCILDEIPNDEYLSEKLIWETLIKNLESNIDEKYKHLAIKIAKEIKNRITTREYNIIYNESFNSAYKNAYKELKEDFINKKNIYKEIYNDIYQKVKTEKYEEITREIDENIRDDIQALAYEGAVESENNSVKLLYEKVFNHIKILIVSEKSVRDAIAKRIRDEVSLSLLSNNNCKCNIPTDIITNKVKEDLKKDKKYMEKIQKEIINDIAKSLFEKE